jgi:hypothetical protein
MNSKSIALLSTLAVILLSAVSSAKPSGCTFETLKDGRTQITCPKVPVVKVSR